MRFIVRHMWIVILFVVGCAQTDSFDPVQLGKSDNSAETNAYTCGVGLMELDAELVKKDDSSLRLQLEIADVHSTDGADNPFLDLGDFKLSDSHLVFESIDSNDENLFHTWQLVGVNHASETLRSRDLAKEILKTKNVFVSVVRVAFNDVNVHHALQTSASNKEAEPEDDGHAHDSHGHGGAHNHGQEQRDDSHAQTRADFSGQSTLTFAVYQQLRGQRQPSWCQVTAPVDIQETEPGVYAIEVLESANGQTAISEEDGYQPHHHEH